ncbi:MAG: adenosylcobinamide amidohydrolase [Acidimicrobiales bacterium]
MVSPHRHPIGDQTGVMVWQWPTPRPVLSSAPVGGGHRFAPWLLNIGVPIDYARTDLAVHAQEIADELALSGEGVTLLTAADVRMAQRSERARASRSTPPSGSRSRPGRRTRTVATPHGHRGRSTSSSRCPWR